MLDTAITFSDLLSLKLEKYNLSQSTKVICKKSSMLHFYGILTVQISNLDFFGCGGSRAQAIGQLSIIGTSFNGRRSQGTALELVEVRGIIEGSTFQFNVVGNLKNVIVEKWMREKAQLCRVGGALIVEQSNITIIGSWFKRNAAEVGGALFCGLESSIEIINSIFIWNRADNLKSSQCYGGALFSQGGCKVVIYNCMFNHNFVCSFNDEGGGGAITAFNASEIDVSNSEFKFSDGVSGGAIVAWKSTLRIKECQFLNNTATLDGGSICAWESTVNISLSTFSGNRAQGHGGALSMRGETMDISVCKFNDNTANQQGGTISATNGHVIINKSVFVDNQVSIDGGAVGTVRCTLLKINGSEFNGNKANSGGALKDFMSSTVNIVGSSFFNNYADGRGGAISLWSPSETVSINMSGFTNNNANYSGGAIYLEGVSAINITWNVFTNNKAKFDGGAVHVSQFKLMYAAQNRFVSNMAMFDGGAMAVTNTRFIVSKICVYNTIFSDNLVAQNGGAINLVSDSISSNTTIVTAVAQGLMFSNNEAATGNGGAIYAQKIAISLSDIVFQENKADTGVVYLSQSAAIFTNNVTLYNNTAGPVFLFSSNMTSMESSKVKIHSNNPSQKDESLKASLQQGGAVTAIQSNVALHGTAILEANNAENGGAIHATESKVLVYGELIIAYNMATESGGGLHLYQSELNCKLKSVLKITNNIALLKGGGIHTISSVITSEVKEYTASSVLIGGNRAKLGGGVNLEVSSKIYILKL